MRRRGSAIVEFTLVGTFIFVPILAGLGTVGFSLIRGMEASSLNSTAGQMISSGIDLSQSANQQNLEMISGNLNLSANGVVIVSEIQGTGNNGGAVCTLQLYIGGNPTGRTSSFVNPSSGILDSNGDVNNLNDPTAQLGANFTSMFNPPLAAGQTVYLAETYFTNTLYSFNGNGTGIYVMNVF